MIDWLIDKVPTGVLVFIYISILFFVGIGLSYILGV